MSTERMAVSSLSTKQSYSLYSRSTRSSLTNSLWREAGNRRMELRFESLQHLLPYVKRRNLQLSCLRQTLLEPGCRDSNNTTGAVSILTRRTKVGSHGSCGPIWKQDLIKLIR